MEAGTCRDCEGDCINHLNSVFCGCASFNGAFAYGPDGLLTERFLKSALAEHKSGDVQPQWHFCPNRAQCDFTAPGEGATECPGHSNRTFIKECWVLCGCSTACRNRVVQRGITRRLEVCCCAACAFPLVSCTAAAASCSAWKSVGLI